MTDTVQDLLNRIDIAEQDYELTADEKTLPDDVKKQVSEFRCSKVLKVIDGLAQQIMLAQPQSIDDLARKSEFLLEYYAGLSLHHTTPEEAEQLMQMETHDRLLYAFARDAKALAGMKLKLDAEGRAVTQDGKPVFEAA